MGIHSTDGYHEHSTAHFNSAFLLTNINSASVQALHGHGESLPLCPKPVDHWNGTALKYHRPGRLGVPTHLESGWEKQQRDRDLLLPSSADLHTLPNNSIQQA